MKKVNYTKNCAYCKTANAQLTREHIIPKFLIEMNPDYKCGYSEIADKYLDAESKIKDVCAQCNNGSLSVLDAYASSFCKENSLDKVIIAEAINLKYDFLKLLRWLLKISYNSARASNRHVEWLKKYIPLILNGDHKYKKSFIELHCEFIQPYRLTNYDKTIVSEDLDVLKPEMIRISYLLDNATNGCIRSVSLNSIVFYILIHKPSSSSIVRSQFRERFSELTANCSVQLVPGFSHANIPLSKRNVYEVYSRQCEATIDQWLDFTRKKRK